MPDGAVHEGVSFKTTPMEIIKKISNSLAGKAVIAKVKYSNRVATLDTALVHIEEEEHTSEDADWAFWELERPLEGSASMKVLTFDDDEGKMTFWHTSAHVLGACLE